MTRPNLDRLILGWRGPVLAAAVALAAGLPGLLMTPVLDRTEARVVQVSARMLDRGDWVDTHYADEDRLRTAPGLHWLQAASTAVFSDVQDRDIRPYRLPSLLGAMLAAWACAWGAGALFGARAGFLAGALLGASFLMSTLAGVAQPSALMAGLVILSLAALGRLYVLAREGEAEASASGGPPPPLPRTFKLMAWGGLAGSILVGGLGGLVVIGLTLIALGVMDRRWRWMGRLGWLGGLCLIVVVVGPWIIAATVSTDGRIWSQLIQNNALARIIDGRAEWGLPGRHLLLAPLLLFPATLLAPAALAAGLTRRTEPGVRFALAWLIPAWILFELAPDLMWHQPLPLYAAAAWLGSAALVRPMGRFARWGGALLAAVGGLYMTGAVLYALSEFGGEAARAWATPTIGLTLGAAAIGGFLLYHRMAVTAALVSIGLGLLAHAGLAGLARNLEPLWVSPRLDAAMTEAGLHPVAGRYRGPVSVVGYDQPSVAFLFAGAAQSAGPQDAARAVLDRRPAVVEERQDPAFRAALARLGGEARAEGRVEGVNYATGDRVVLTLYRPLTRPPSTRREAARVAPEPTPSAPQETPAVPPSGGAETQTPPPPEPFPEPREPDTPTSPPPSQPPFAAEPDQ